MREDVGRVSGVDDGVRIGISPRAGRVILAITHVRLTGPVHTDREDHRPKMVIPLRVRVIAVADADVGEILALEIQTVALRAHELSKGPRGRITAGRDVLRCE